MKTNRTLQMWAALILGIWPVTADCQIQTYYYSGPVSGWSEVDLTPGPPDSGGFETTFGTLTETLYYDPSADTLEQVGSVTVNTSSGSFNIKDLLSGVVVGSATLAVGNSGSVSFNNTFAGITSGRLFESDLLVPVSGSGTYNGQAFSGAWNIDIPISAEATAINSTSLTFSEFQEPNGQNGPGSYGAMSGMPAVPIPGTSGLMDGGGGDGTYYYSWQLNDVTATAVPEPNSLALLGLGLSALAFLRRR